VSVWSSTVPHGTTLVAEAIELSERPIIFSHSGAYAVCAHIRNIRDEQIRACAGARRCHRHMGIGAFLGDAQARSESMVGHIDHVATLVGAQHVGIGTDYVRTCQGYGRQFAHNSDTRLAGPDRHASCLRARASSRNSCGTGANHARSGYSSNVVKDILERTSGESMRTLRAPEVMTIPAAANRRAEP